MFWRGYKGGGKDMESGIIDAENPPWCPLLNEPCKSNCVWRYKFRVKGTTCALVALVEVLTMRL